MLLVGLSDDLSELLEELVRSQSVTLLAELGVEVQNRMPVTVAESQEDSCEDIHNLDMRWGSDRP